MSRPHANTPYYDHFSRHYESRRRLGYHALLDDLEASIVLGYARSNSALLEVGCGTGLIMERLKDRVQSVVGLDASERMLEKARAKALDVRQGLAESLPFPDRSFDVVYSFKVLAHVEQIHQALDEMARVTKKGGFVIAEFYNARSLRGLRWQARKKWLSLFGPKGRLTEKDIFTRYDDPENVRSYFPPSLQLLETRGLIVWTPAAVLHRVPGLASALRELETCSSRGVLSRVGGFMVYVLEKA